VRRVRYHSHGGPEVLAIEEAGVPVPGPGQVLIRTEAIGVNWVDVQLRRETAPGSIYFRALPATLTGDVAGTVEAIGPGADPGLTGARVAVLSEDAYADYVLARTDWLVRVPDGLGAGAATMLPMTAPLALGLLRAGRLAQGETVLVTAGAGVIGHLAVQLARRLGAGTVVATAGSDAKLGLVKELGADVAISHRDPGWADQVRPAVPGGVDVALDAIGGQFLVDSVGVLAPFGRAVAYGGAAGGMGSVPVLALARLKTVTGFSLLAWRAAAPEQVRAAITEAAELLASGRLRAVADTALPLSEAVQAHRLLEERTVPGRILLVP
jgi:NADPH:quinone reductase